MDHHDSTHAINESYDPKEMRYRILAVVVFVIDVIGTISSFAWMIQSFVGGHNIGSSIGSFVIGLIGLLLLYNGLYGHHRRGISLLVYAVVFEFIPAFIYTVLLLFFVFAFGTMKSQIDKEIKNQGIHVNAGAAMAVIITLLILIDAYHIFAGLVVNTYLKLQYNDDRAHLINENYNPSEGFYRILAVVVFIIDIISTVSSLGWMIQSIDSGNNVGSSIVSFVVALVGFLLLYNGLFGKQCRGKCLYTYAVVFEFIPCVLYTILLCILIFAYKPMKAAIEEAFKKQEILIGSAAAMAAIITSVILLDIYHYFAGKVVHNYRKLRKQREADF